VYLVGNQPRAVFLLPMPTAARSQTGDATLDAVAADTDSQPMNDITASQAGRRRFDLGLDPLRCVRGPLG
jgi:hypothetical protein